LLVLIYKENGGREMSGCLKWFGILFIVIILIGACTAVLGSDEESTPKTEEKSSKDSAASSTGKTFKVGDTVKVGDMQYKVKSVATAKEVGPTYGKENAKDTYVVIDVVVKNNGNEAVTVDTALFTLLKGDKKFEADSAASMSANQSEDGNIDNSFFLESINPDSKLEGKVVFDVSSSIASSNALKLQVQTGFWGTETEVIKLK